MRRVSGYLQCKSFLIVLMKNDLGGGVTFPTKRIFNANWSVMKQFLGDRVGSLV